MQIRPEQVAKETNINDVPELLDALKAAGVKDPKIVLVFDSNGRPVNANDIGWEVRVFYNSPDPLQVAKLNEEVVLGNPRMIPENDEIIKTIYPDGYTHWCGKINGTPVWIP
jgi:hypothetical protein